MKAWPSVDARSKSDLDMMRGAFAMPWRQEGIGSGGYKESQSPKSSRSLSSFTEDFLCTFKPLAAQTLSNRVPQRVCAEKKQTS